MGKVIASCYDSSGAGFRRTRPALSSHSILKYCGLRIRWQVHEHRDRVPGLQTFPLGAQWPTMEPFLFVAHHRDDYPEGMDDLGPAPEQLAAAWATTSPKRTAGRCTTAAGWATASAPGFETITHVRHGLIDHADSTGATARFGHGDTQWMTAGKGVQHCEMFPLVNKDSGNLGELFQIWLNLPAADKMVDPYFTMLWNERTEGYVVDDRITEITVIAGHLGETAADTTSQFVGLEARPRRVAHPHRSRWPLDRDHERKATPSALRLRGLQRAIGTATRSPPTPALRSWPTVISNSSPATAASR